MSKRVTLSDRECEYIITALKDKKRDGLDYLNRRIGNQVLQGIIDKLTPDTTLDSVKITEEGSD